MFTQKRFLTIGGKAARAGSGRTHSRTSVKQVNAIPTAPGSVDKKRDPRTAPLFIPMSRISHPQLKLRSPNGRWKGIDTSFADLHGISDMVVTLADDVPHRAASEVAASLIEACNTYAVEAPIAKFRNTDLSMNSGPEQDSIQNFTLKRRQWFSIVRSFYVSQSSLWQPSEADTAPIHELFTLISHLDSASQRHIGRPEAWEDEPAESYLPLPLGGLVKLLALAMEAQNFVLANCSSEMLIECAALSRKYNVSFDPRYTDASSSMRACLLALCSVKDLSFRHALAMARVICDTSQAEDLNVTVIKASHILSCPPDMSPEEHQGLLTHFFVSLAQSGKSTPFDNYVSDDLCTLLTVSAAARRANPKYFESKSTLAHLVGAAAETVKALLATGKITAQPEDGYNPLQDFGNDLRVSHPDIHPHLKLRRSFSEGRFVSHLNKKVAAMLLKAYTAYLHSCDASTRYSTITSQLLQRTAEGEGADDTKVGAVHYLDTLEIAVSKSNALKGGKKLDDLLRAADNSLANTVTSLGTADRCVRFLECFAKCQFVPINLGCLVDELLRRALTTTETSRVAVALAEIGAAETGAMHSLATILLRNESSSAMSSDIICFLHAASQSLVPTDALSVIDRIVSHIPMTDAATLSPADATQVAQIIAVTTLADVDAQTHTLAQLSTYLVQACTAPTLTYMDLVAITSTCVTAETSFSEEMIDAIKGATITEANLAGLSAYQLTAVLAAVPSVEMFDCFQSELARAASAALSHVAVVDPLSQNAVVDLAAATKLLELARDSTSKHTALNYIVRAIVSLERLDNTSACQGLVDGVMNARDTVMKLNCWEEAERLFAVQQ